LFSPLFSHQLSKPTNDEHGLPHKNKFVHRMNRGKKKAPPSVVFWMAATLIACLMTGSALSRLVVMESANKQGKGSDIDTEAEEATAAKQLDLILREQLHLWEEEGMSSLPIGSWFVGSSGNEKVDKWVREKLLNKEILTKRVLERIEENEKLQREMAKRKTKFGEYVD